MSYDEFWLVYLRAHGRKLTRALHYIGTLLALGAVAAALLVNVWIALAAPVIGYGFAWTAHFWVEKNRPATFGHPLWSLYSDFRMLALFLSGRLGPHLARAGVRS